MNWFAGLVVYLLLWWLILFAVLPWGVRTPEKGEVMPGHADSAPKRPRLWLKAAATTLLAGLIWAAIYWAIAADLFSFRTSGPIT